MSELLQAYLADGTIWVENGTYFARCADGTIVQIGNDAQDVDRYLHDYPKPTDW